MTRRQAIVILKAMMVSESDPKRYQAIYLAIKALETMEYVEGGS